MSETAIAQALERLAAQVHHARLMMADGRDPPITNLEAQVLDLCRGVESLPLPAARALRPRMTALLDDLNQLDQAMRRRHGELGGDLGQMAARRRAVAAYVPPAKSGSR